MTDTKTAPHPDDETRTIPVAVVDNHEATREGVLARLRQHPHEFNVYGAYAHESEIPYDDPAPSLVVLDMYLDRDDRLSIPEIPRLIEWGAAVVVHTAEEKAAPMRQAVSLGAAGVALKSDGLDALLDVLREVVGGGFVYSSLIAHALATDPDATANLTPRELDVLRNIEDGLTQAQTARRLGIASDTVKTHLAVARRKYLAIGRGVTNTGRVVREASDDGWLD